MVLHLTEWAEYRDLDPVELLSVVRAPRLLDGRNVLPLGRWQWGGRYNPWACETLSSQHLIMSLRSGARRACQVRPGFFCRGLATAHRARRMRAELLRAGLQALGSPPNPFRNRYLRLPLQRSPRDSDIRASPSRVIDR